MTDNQGLKIQSMIRDDCWVCGVRFSDARPPGQANKERHHIIPRKAGGENGPTVDICDHHHTMLHKVALRLKSGKPHFDLVRGEQGQRLEKILWLATQVHNAFQAVANDPNKQVTEILSLNKRDREVVQAIQRIYPQLKSRRAVFMFALRSLYSKHFTS